MQGPQPGYESDHSQPGRMAHSLAGNGTTGRLMLDGCDEEWWIVFVASRVRVCRPSGSPVLGLTSKRGNDDEETSTRRR